MIRREHRNQIRHFSQAAVSVFMMLIFRSNNVCRPSFVYQQLNSSLLTKRQMSVDKVFDDTLNVFIVILHLMSFIVVLHPVSFIVRVHLIFANFVSALNCRVR